jgi:siroheme synthase-like protein
MRLPTVLNVDGPVIVFGGGDVGLRKVEYLCRFNSSITVVDEMDVPLPEGVTLIQHRMSKQDLSDLVPTGTALVVAAFSSRELNHEIAKDCRNRDILVNVVDDPDVSTILFPALSKAGDVNIAVSTSGRAPFLARKIREELDVTIEEKALWLEVLSPMRDRLTGITEKNRVLEAIYTDGETARLVATGDLEGAKARAWEVFDVFSEP